MFNYIKLIRPINLIIIVLTMYLFRLCLVAASPYKLFYVQPILTSLEFLILVFATIFIAAGGYVINDIFDVDIDSINRPQKVIVGNLIDESKAYNFYKLLCLLGIISTVVLAIMTKNFRLSTLPILVMVILNFYAHTFKKQLIVGNFMIALCTAFTIILIGLFENSETAEITANESSIRSGIAVAAVVYGLFAFLTTFLRELIKDIEDQIGDEQYDSRTIPIVFGEKIAKLFAYGLGVLLMLLLVLFAVFFNSIHLKNCSLFISIGLIFPLFVINIFIFLAKTKDNYHFVSNLIKVFMCIGILTMLYFRSGIGPYIFIQFVNFMNKLL